MISEGSCYTEDWSNDAENSALTTTINYILKYNHISAVKIRVLTQTINFSSLTVLKTGVELGLPTPLTTADSVSFFLDKDCVYLDAERLYEHIKQQFFQTHAPLHQARPGACQTCAETVQVTRSFSRTTVNCGQMRCCQDIMSVKTNFPVLSAVILCS